MHAVLLTLVIVTGAEQPAVVADQQPYMAPAAGSCDTCQGEASAGGARGGCVGDVLRWTSDWFGPMPQTCYAPRFGCYPGNDRYMHRYPAFHGYYYREPYNYRNYFDYPWHAQPHEPMGYFTYQKSPSVDGTPTPPDDMPPAQVEPQPVPSPPAAPEVSQSGWKPAKPPLWRN